MYILTCLVSLNVNVEETRLYCGFINEELKFRVLFTIATRIGPKQAPLTKTKVQYT